MMGAGLTEIMTYSFDSPDSYRKLNLPEDHELGKAVTIQNPLTTDWSILRTSLVPHLLDVLRHNAQRQQYDLQVFEIGSVFVPEELPLTKQPDERLTLGIALMGNYPRDWGFAPREVDFFELKGLVEAVLDDLGLSCQWEKTNHPSLHPGRLAAVKVGNTKVGVMGEVHPEVGEMWELPARAYVAELSLEAILPQISRQKRVDKLPRYPAVARDLALLAPDAISAQKVLEVMWAAGGDLVKEIIVLYIGQTIRGHRVLLTILTRQCAP